MNRYSILEDDLIEAIDLKKDMPNVNNILNLKWDHIPPMIRANQLYNILGKPARYDIEPGGCIVWRNVDPYFRSTNNIIDKHKPVNVYSKLIIKDEEIPHIVPGPHTDWFYAYMYMDIPSNKVNDVLALTESIGYDTMSKEIYARCHFMPANLTSLYLAKQIALGIKNITHAQQEYVALIPTLAKEDMNGGGLMNGDNDTKGPWHITLTKYLFNL